MTGVVCGSQQQQRESGSGDSFSVGVPPTFAISPLLTAPRHQQTSSDRVDLGCACVEVSARGCLITSDWCSMQSFVACLTYRKGFGKSSDVLRTTHLCACRSPPEVLPVLPPPRLPVGATVCTTAIVHTASMNRRNIVVCERGRIDKGCNSSGLISKIQDDVCSTKTLRPYSVSLIELEYVMHHGVTV